MTRDSSYQVPSLTHSSNLPVSANPSAAKSPVACQADCIHYTANLQSPPALLHRRDQGNKGMGVRTREETSSTSPAKDLARSVPRSRSTKKIWPPHRKGFFMATGCGNHFRPAQLSQTGTTSGPGTLPSIRDFGVHLLVSGTAPLPSAAATGTRLPVVHSAEVGRISRVFIRHKGCWRQTPFGICSHRCVLADFFRRASPNPTALDMYGI